MASRTALPWGSSTASFGFTITFTFIAANLARTVAVTSRSFTRNSVPANVARDEGNELAHPCRMAHAVCGLEFDLAGDQSWLARSPADLVRRDPICNCRRSAHGRLDWTRPTATAPTQRLRVAGRYWSADVRPELWASLLGRTARLLRSSGSFAGNHLNVRDSICALDVAGRT